MTPNQIDIYPSEELVAEALRVGEFYCWKCEPRRHLEYTGLSESRVWHQFALASDPSKKCWCEVLSEDLHMLKPVTGPVDRRPYASE